MVQRTATPSADAGPGKQTRTDTDEQTSSAKQVSSSRTTHARCVCPPRTSALPDRRGDGERSSDLHPPNNGIRFAYTASGPAPPQIRTETSDWARCSGCCTRINPPPAQRVSAPAHAQRTHAHTIAAQACWHYSESAYLRRLASQAVLAFTAVIRQKSQPGQTQTHKRGRPQQLRASGSNNQPPGSHRVSSNTHCRLLSLHGHSDASATAAADASATKPISPLRRNAVAALKRVSTVQAASMVPAGAASF